MYRGTPVNLTFLYACIKWGLPRVFIIKACYPDEFHMKCPHMYEGGSESFVIGVITLLIDIIGCCIMP